jgi:hypothetical protein
MAEARRRYPIRRYDTDEDDAEPTHPIVIQPKAEAQ